MSDMWYLMNAFALTEKRKCPITDVSKHWDKCVVYVVRTQGGRTMFCVSAGSFGNYASVGNSVKWTIDTGSGHKRPSYEHDQLLIENIIEFSKDVTSNEIVITKKVNEVGLNDKRPIWVFK